MVIVIITDILRDRFNMIEKFNNQLIIVRWAIYFILIVMFVVFGVYGGSFEANDFIYRFF